MLDVIDVILEFDKGIIFGGAVALLNQALRLRSDNDQLTRPYIGKHHAPFY